MKKLITAILIAGGAGAALADGLKSLESFMTNTRAGKAEFTQTVTSPPRRDRKRAARFPAEASSFSARANSSSTTPSLLSSSSSPMARRCGCMTPT